MLEIGKYGSVRGVDALCRAEYCDTPQSKEGRNWEHKVCLSIRAIVHLLDFLPPYSPDLNPIEKMWSKIKSILRTLKARTEKALINAIAKALDAVTPSDVKGWFESCGYTNTLN